jgi:hypothetical protein
VVCAAPETANLDMYKQQSDGVATGMDGVALGCNLQRLLRYQLELNWRLCLINGRCQARKPLGKLCRKGSTCSE